MISYNTYRGFLMTLDLRGHQKASIVSFVNDIDTRCQAL